MPAKKTAPLILASASPRRSRLLREWKIPHRVVPSGLSEPPPGLMEPAAYARKLALAKARLVASKVGEGLVLGADTVVVLQGEILGKPADFAEGCRMLSKLQGTTHTVITAVALVEAATSEKGKTTREKVAHTASRVTMRRLDLTGIARCARNHLDKAGCYAVQERKDPVVSKIRGSYTNVVGLPKELVQKLLKSAG